MSDESEKPFEATPRRIARAHREGNAARSSELSANLAFAASAVAAATMMPTVAGLAAVAVRGSFGAPAVRESAAVIGAALIPVAAAALGGLAANVAQSGGIVAIAVAPKLERLNPLDGFKRILSRETLAHSIRAGCAFLCAAAAMAPFLAWSFSASVQAARLQEVASAAWTACRGIAFAAVSVGFAFAVAEYASARRVWLRKLRMSFEERRRETKEEEGDAASRGRRRALHRAFLRSGMRRLRDAAFVVANPTHVAVALEYRPPDVPVPRALVCAADAQAAAVRAFAAERGVPIVENVWLARALYRDCRAGEPIPHAHYIAVAEVVTALVRRRELAR